VIGGLVIEVRKFCRSTGPSLSPFNAWVLSKSLKTLAVRLDRRCENAAKLAHYLESHGSPGGAGITDGLIRISVGLEHIEDVLGNLNHSSN
jgi:cystathionine beta-lyase/cystathionine gamma-synthase